MGCIEKKIFSHSSEGVWSLCGPKDYFLVYTVDLPQKCLHLF